MPRFICVRFQVDGRIVVVHESWLVGEAHCRWPQSGNIEEMVKSGTKPKSEWGVWETDILGGDDEYETCARRAYSTQQSWGSHPKVQTYTDDKDGTPVTTSITSLSTPNVRPLLDMGGKESTSSHSTPNPRKRKATDSDIKATLARLEESIATINKNLSSRLETIEDKLKPILNDSTIGGNRSPTLSPTYSPKFERHCHTVMDPATTLEELSDWLDQQDVYAVAKRVTCVTLRATVRSFIRTSMTKGLARTFSWSGLGSRRLKTKTSFKEHKAFNYLIDVLHETPYKNATQTEVADSIKKVLIGVADWDGGRTAKYHSFPTIAFFP